MTHRRAVVVGLDYHARFLADVLNASSTGWHLRAYGSSRTGTLRALLALRKADALICFGGPAPNAALSIVAKRFNVPVIVIWAGSDVTKARSNPFDLEMIKQERMIHLAVAPWLVGELAGLGIEAQYVPVAGMTAGAPIKPLPQSFRVLTYLPEPRRDFYGEALVYEVARTLPEIQFDVVGAGGRSADAPLNVRFHGHVSDMQARLDDCTVLLRQPEHDGMSVLVLEALSRARHVIWNYDIPHVRVAAGPDGTLAQLRDLIAAYAEGTLTVNEAGREYVLSHFSREDVAAKISETLDWAVDEAQVRQSTAKRRVAISGLGLFCGDVVRHAKELVPEWDARMMRTNSRLELLTSAATMATCDVWYSIGSAASDRLLHRLAGMLGKPRVIHWVGSDIARLAVDPDLRTLLTAPNVRHLAEVNWTAAQLKALGFDADIAPLPPRTHSNVVPPLPQTFTVLLYVPRTRGDFYGQPAFERLMKRLSDKPIKYVIVGGGSIDVPPGVEAENLGWRNTLTDLYENVSMLIRYTPRDGLSLMVLEALSFGRHVLWTQPLPFVRRIATYEDMERQIRVLLEQHEQGELHPQAQAAQFVRNEYLPEKCITAIARSWDQAAEGMLPSAPAVQTP